MSLNEKIADLLEEELKLRMDLLLTEYAETISRKYQISLQLLLKDIPCVSVTSTCIFTIGCFDKFHKGHIKLLENMQKQGEKIIIGLHDNNSIKKHGPGLRNVSGCPACERSFSTNRLIDLDSLLNNE